MHFKQNETGGTLCNTANIPGTVVSYKHRFHQGDDCKVHISSLLRNQNSEIKYFSQEVMQDETDSGSMMKVFHNFLIFKCQYKKTFVSMCAERPYGASH